MSRSGQIAGGDMTKQKRETHGARYTPGYQAWRQMRTRCNNPNFRQYADYGGRGVRICSAWDSFAAFWADMGPSWRPGLSLDRIDNEGDYGPSNCRWADKITQANNTRANRFIDTPSGRLTVADAARTFGIGYDCLLNRLRRGAPEGRLFQRARLKPSTRRPKVKVPGMNP